MATRYLFKVEYGVERFCSFFVNLLEHSDYSFVNLTNDIRANVRALQITTPATIRIRFRDEDGDYINLPYGDTEMFKEMFKSGHPVKDRDYTKICIKVSELDSPVQISQSGLCGASDAKRPKIKVEPRDVEPIFIEDEDDGKVGKAVQLTKISSQPMRAVWKNQQTPRSLDSNSCDVADINDEKVHLAPSQPPTETMSVMKNPSPLQRYVEKLEGNVNDQRRKVTLMKDDLRIIEEKLTQAKSAQLGEGTVCGNCHLRLGHTSRNCSIEKCTDVFGCGVEKFHARQVNRTKLSQGIKKEETTLQRLEQELENRRSAVTSLAKAPASKIEERLSSENGSDYVVGCMRNWSLLRTHVHLIEDYCKRYFHGKVPPKQNLSDILRLAINCRVRPVKTRIMPVINDD